MRTEVIRQRRARKRFIGLAAMLGAAFGVASPAVAQTATSTVPKPTTVEMLTWDLPEEADNQPGAVVVDVSGDSNRLWFVTRIAGGAGTSAATPAPRVYRLELRGGKKVNDATWFSWSLFAGFANGVRRIKTSGDKRYAFVHTQLSLQRIDTGNCGYYSGGTKPTCTSLAWPHNIPADATTVVNPDHGSDVAIDESDNNKVYTAIAAVGANSSANAGADRGFVQRLIPDASSNNVTRWYVGGGVGLCVRLDSTPCLSGVAVDRRFRDVVYYSEPTGGPDGRGAIGEINTRTNIVRRWYFSELALRTNDESVREPRQLIFDNDGRVWVVTGSGHLVSLDPKKNLMSKHRMPAADPMSSFTRDPFGVAPDGGLIGYTDSTDGDSRVGMLMPDRDLVVVKAVSDPYVDYATFTQPPTPFDSERASGTTRPARHTVPGQIVRNEDGTWSEARTSDLLVGNFDGNMPLGITPDQTARQGTFFFAVGDPLDFTFNRVARIRLPKGDMRGHDNRDDDDCDDDGKRADVDDDVDDDGMPNAYDSDSDNDGVADVLDDDDDNDGIEDSFDTKDKKERKRTSDQQVASGEYSESLFTLAPGTLLAVASAVSTDPLAQVKIEVVDAAGAVVASSVAAVGASTLTWVPPAAGGDYTMRVKNVGLGTSTISTKLLTRELYSILF